MDKCVNKHTCLLITDTNTTNNNDNSSQVSLLKQGDNMIVYCKIVAHYYSLQHTHTHIYRDIHLLFSFRSLYS